ncbi:MAG: HNH endonuclease, partial [Salinivirgaceae bacterium]|nr:HNH endonuclease [Salinivirgaceae bacterium]
MEELKEYKFNRVYEFADMVYSCLFDVSLDYWGYDIEQFIEATINFNKISLLHMYIYDMLTVSYNEKFFDNNDMYSEENDEYDKWFEIANSFGIQFNSEFDCERGGIKSDFYKWYKDNEFVFDEIFQNITNEVFYILYTDHNFLLNFNKTIAAIIKNADNERDWNYPDNILTKKGTIKRKNIPQWVKDAVFHRDHGRCVFCNKDLTGRYTHLNKRNFDHIIPLNKYGSNDPNNIQLTCEKCNKEKND